MRFQQGLAKEGDHFIHRASCGLVRRIYQVSGKDGMRRLSLRLKAAPVRNVPEIELTVGKLGRKTGSGLIAPSDVFVNDQRDVIIKSALQHGVPMISVYRAFVVGGGL